MKVERLDRSSGGSCNFCTRGELSHHTHAHLVYPYDTVTTFCNEKGGGIKASICDDCLEELYAKTKMDQL